MVRRMAPPQKGATAQHPFQIHQRRRQCKPLHMQSFVGVKRSGIFGLIVSIVWTASAQQEGCLKCSWAVGDICSACGKSLCSPLARLRCDTESSDATQ